MGFAVVAVSQFLICWQRRLISTVLHRIKFCIVDETNITFNPKGQKNSCNEDRSHIGGLSSANKDEVVKAEMCFSASGAFMPRMLIFARKRTRKEFHLICYLVHGLKYMRRGWLRSLYSVPSSMFAEFSGARNGHQCFWIDAGPTRKAYSSSVWCEKMA